MMCAWQSLLGILPQWLRAEVDRLGKLDAEQIRLRTGFPPRLVLSGRSIDLMGMVTEQDLSFVINQASRYSPWSIQSIGQGYITSAGGHRIGICGEAIMKNGEMTGVRTLTSLCIRIARDHRGIGDGIKGIAGSVVILGAPGWGKTTLLVIWSGLLLNPVMWLLWMNGRNCFRWILTEDPASMFFPDVQSPRGWIW